MFFILLFGIAVGIVVASLIPSIPVWVNTQYKKLL